MAKLASCLAALIVLSVGAAMAQTAAPPHDNLNATLWMQRSVEYKASALAAFALARFRLDEALADKSWTAAPAEQKGNSRTSRRRSSSTSTRRWSTTRSTRCGC